MKLNKLTPTGSVRVYLILEKRRSSIRAFKAPLLWCLWVSTNKLKVCKAYVRTQVPQEQLDREYIAWSREMTYYIVHGYGRECGGIREARPTIAITILDCSHSSDGGECVATKRR